MLMVVHCIQTCFVTTHLSFRLNAFNLIQPASSGLVENAGTRICGYADMRVCGYAGMRVRRTGLTNRFQKLINNSNKIIAVNTKNHSCEGVFICGKTHVDFHKTLTSIFSAYTTSIY